MSGPARSTRRLEAKTPPPRPRPQPPPRERLVLHVGCGPKNPAKLQATFRQPGWREVRFDIDPRVQPDIIGTMVDMAAVATESMDAVWSSHNIEHLYAHQVPLALNEFFRVIRPGGFVVITCPDLQAVARLIAEDRLDQPAYISPAGPIAPLDIVYGLGSAVSRGNEFMAHRTGFTVTTLAGGLERAGFAAVSCKAGQNLDLWATGTRPAR